MDIDIDFSGDFDPKDLFPQCVNASMAERGVLRKHPAGVYFQNIPIDPLTKFSAIPYKEAENIGYMKIDCLHLPSVLDYFQSKKEIRALMEIEPDWSLLKNKSAVEKLFQIRNHFDVISRIRPKSAVDLADCIALIRPGKKVLVKKYIQDKEKIRKVLYREPADGSYYFKRSHAIAYAFCIIIQLHLVKKGIL